MMLGASRRPYPHDTLFWEICHCTCPVGESATRAKRIVIAARKPYMSKSFEGPWTVATIVQQIGTIIHCMVLSSQFFVIIEMQLRTLHRA